MMKSSVLHLILCIASNLMNEVVMFEHSLSELESVVQALIDENKDMKMRIAALERKDAENNLRVGNLKNCIVALEEKCSRISDKNVKSDGVANVKVSFNSSYTSAESKEETFVGNSETNFAPGFDENIDMKQSRISSSELLLRPRQSAKRAVEREVAFHVYLSANRCYSNHEIFIFDREAVDIGGGYNIHDGIFDAPATGLYVFTWTVTASYGTWFAAELIVNGVVEGAIMTDSDVNSSAAGIHPATGVVLTNVNAGDHVFIRFVQGDSCNIRSDSYTRTTFSGWLLL